MNIVLMPPTVRPRLASPRLTTPSLLGTARRPQDIVEREAQLTTSRFPCGLPQLDGSRKKMSPRQAGTGWRIP